MLTQSLLHTGGVERAARVEQGRQRRLHARLTLACRQVQDAQVLPGRPGRLPLHETVVGHAEAAGGKHLGTVAVVGERPRLAHQPVDDVPVVDFVLAPPAQPGHLLHALLGVPQFDPLGVQPRLEPLADQPAGHRVDVARHPDGAARLHPHAQPFARLQTARRQGPQQGHLLGQSVLTSAVELGEHVAQEGGVGIAAGEVTTAAQHQGLVQGPLELTVALLGVTVLVALAGLDGLGSQAVVVQQGLVTSLERLRPPCGLHAGGQAVGAVQLGHAAQLPQGVLQALAEALVALGEAHGARLPVGVGQHEVVDQVGEGDAIDGHAQVGAVGEVTGGQPSGVVDLSEEDFPGRAVLGPPLLDAPLQSPQLTVGEVSRVPPLQGLEEGFGLQAGVYRELLFNPGPDHLEGVLACPPGVLHAYLAGQSVQPLVLACRLAVHTGLGSSQRQRHTLVQRLAQAQNLLVRDHRGLLSGQATPMVSARSQPGEF